MEFNAWTMISFERGAAASQREPELSNVKLKG